MYCVFLPICTVATAVKAMCKQCGSFYDAIRILVPENFLNYMSKLKFHSLGVIPSLKLHLFCVVTLTSFPLTIGVDLYYKLSFYVKKLTL
jgi:hypothetical protein